MRNSANSEVKAIDNEIIPNCKKGFSWDQVEHLCVHHFIDPDGNDCWTGQNGSGGGCQNINGIRKNGYLETLPFSFGPD
jgi:hypothetical protein